MFACLHAPSRFGASNDALASLASAFSPIIQRTTPDTVVFSISGLGKLIGSVHQIAAEIARRGAEAGVRANLAVAGNPDTAVLAARNLAGVTLIAPGREADLLGTISVQALDADPELLDTLDRWGVKTLADLGALPEMGLAARFGDEGVRLRRLALGETSRSLCQSPPVETFERRAEMEHPQTLIEPLLFVISAMIHELVEQLEATNRITLRLTLEGGAEHERTLEFPVPVREAKTLLKQLQFDLEAHPPRGPIVAAAVRLNPVAPRVLQHGLFLPPAPEPEKLQIVLARVAALVGEENAGSPELLDTHRPGAFRMKPFSAPAPTRPAAGPSRGILRFAFRYFRPSRAATVRVKQERPVHLSAAGVRGDVQAAAGPWRTAGEWWTETQWARDEWDVGLTDGALYRIYCELESRDWFVEGLYD